MHTLTREDYRLWPDNHKRAWHHLKDTLLTKTLLIVGYSMSDSHFDHLLAVLKQMTAGQPKQMYAWMWQAALQYIKLLEKWDNIEAISIVEEGHWARAFDQLREAIPCECDAPCEIVDTDVYSRQQYKVAVEQRYGKANVYAFYLPGAGYACEDVTLEEIFVLPDLEPMDRAVPSNPDPGDVADEDMDELDETHNLR